MLSNNTKLLLEANGNDYKSYKKLEYSLDPCTEYRNSTALKDTMKRCLNNGVGRHINTVLSAMGTPKEWHF